MILLHEPDPAVRARLTEALAAEGEVRVISTFPDVVPAAREARPDVVVFGLDTNSALSADAARPPLHTMGIPVVVTGSDRRLYASFVRSWDASTDPWFLGAAPEPGPVLEAVKRARALARTPAPAPHTRRLFGFAAAVLLSGGFLGLAYLLFGRGSLPFRLAGAAPPIAFAVALASPALAARRVGLALPWTTRAAIGAPLVFAAGAIAVAVWVS